MSFIYMYCSESLNASDSVKPQLKISKLLELKFIIFKIALSWIAIGKWKMKVF